MDSHTASALSRLLSGCSSSTSQSREDDDSSSCSLVHLGDGLTAADIDGPTGSEEEATTFGSLRVVQNERQFLQLDRSTINTGASGSSFFSSVDSSAADQLLRDRILGKVRRMQQQSRARLPLPTARPRRMDQLSFSSSSNSSVSMPNNVAMNLAPSDTDVGHRPQANGQEPSTGSRSSLHGADRPIPLVNLSRRDRFGPGAAAAAGLHELSQRQADTMSNATSKRAIVGSAASADVSHLVLDVRDLAGFKQMRHSELAGALCRWILRRIFRADWNRDCFLCDLPLNHSCLMCFYALHAAPDHEAARSYNAVVCGSIYASCGHVYHRHCWSRWESQLSPCCPKCGTCGISSVDETFIIEKRCG